MTLLCVTSLSLPGVPRCTELGAHRVMCPDHPGWTDRPGICRGCLPRAADRGFLCEACYQRTVDAVAAWGRFRAAVTAAGERLVSPDGGGSSTPAGYSNLSLVFLALDECERLLVSRQDRTVDLWVHDEAGAADAIRFARAAEQAYRSLEVAEREITVVRSRCPSCHQLTVYGNHQARRRGTVTVTCEHCAYLLGEIRMPVPRWFGSATCEHQAHAECESTTCPCHCHTLGAQSRPGGVQALWDADQHRTQTWRRTQTGRLVPRRFAPDQQPYRADWIITDHLTITERKAA